MMIHDLGSNYKINKDKADAEMNAIIDLIDENNPMLEEPRRYEGLRAVC